MGVCVLKILAGTFIAVRVCVCFDSEGGLSFFCATEIPVSYEIKPAYRRCKFIERFKSGWSIVLKHMEMVFLCGSCHNKSETQQNEMKSVLSSEHGSPGFCRTVRPSKLTLDTVPSAASPACWLQPHEHQEGSPSLPTAETKLRFISQPIRPVRKWLKQWLNKPVSTLLLPGKIQYTRLYKY